MTDRNQNKILQERVSSYNEEYEQVPVQNWNARESSTTTEKNRSSVTEYTERYRGENENKSSSIMDEDRITSLRVR